MRRRTFLAAIASAVSGAGCATHAPRSPGGIIDTHVHVYDPRRAQGVPWPPATDAFLYRRVLPRELKTMAAPLGVSGAIVVEASAWEEDNQWVLDLAARDPFLLGLVGHLKPGTERFRDDLERFARNPKFLGIRVGLWNAGVCVERPAWLKDIERLAHKGLTLDVGSGVANMEAASRLAASIPDLRIVINHHGGGLRVMDGTPNARWLAAVEALGKYPRVAMKISGLVESTGCHDGTAPGDISLYVPWCDVVIRVFGEDRLMFGSNWPVSARFAPYDRVLDLAQRCCARLPPSARDKIFRYNSIRFYNVRV